MRKLFEKPATTVSQVIQPTFKINHDLYIMTPSRILGRHTLSWNGVDDSLISVSSQITSIRRNDHLSALFFIKVCIIINLR